MIGGTRFIRCMVCSAFVFSVGTFLKDAVLFAKQSKACGSLLEAVEGAMASAQFDFHMVGSPQVMPVVPNKMSSGSSAMIGDFLYLSSPSGYFDYAAVGKNRTGFGFSPAPHHSFELVRSNKLRVLHITPDGTQSFFAALLASPEFPGSAVIKLMMVSDGETGQLEFIQGIPALELSDLSSKPETIRMVPRVGQPELWVVDGSSQIHGLRFEQESGIEKFIELDLSETQIRGAAIKSIKEIGFVEDGSKGFVLVELKTDKHLLVPFEISETQDEKNPEVSEVGFELKEELSVEVRAGDRFAVRPDLQQLVVFGGNHIRGYTFDDSLKLSFVSDQQPRFLSNGEELVGFDYFWEGVLQKVRGEKGEEKTRFLGEVYAYALVFNPLKNETRVVWLQSAPSIPGAHAGVRP